LHPLWRRRLREQWLLWQANALVATLRVFFRVKEFTAPPQKKARLRAFREQMQAVKRDERAALKRIDGCEPSEVMKVMDDLLERHGMTEEREEHAEFVRSIQRVEQEHQALQQLRQEAGDDKAAATEGTRLYRDTPRKSAGLREPHRATEGDGGLGRGSCSLS
jgi:uncharacterized protein YdiU (UPF0061 family)